jgi:hypothetical protein
MAGVSLTVAQAQDPPPYEIPYRPWSPLDVGAEYALDQSRCPGPVDEQVITVLTAFASRIGDFVIFADYRGAYLDLAMYFTSGGLLEHFEKSIGRPLLDVQNHNMPYRLAGVPYYDPGLDNFVETQS